jgi:hypothetical protein
MCLVMLLSTLGLSVEFLLRTGAPRSTLTLNL